MLKKALLSLAVTAGLVVSFTGCRDAFGSAENRSEWLTGVLENRLDLTADQVQKVKAVTDEIFAREPEFRFDHIRFSDALLVYQTDNESDPGAISNLFQERKAEIDDMRSFMICEIKKINDLLTPGQRIKFAEEMRKFRGERNNPNKPVI